jgi:tRNA uridine 5-carboxymethylaminomethyl modification enzyme
MPGGRMGESTTDGLSRALERLGLRLARFKTGTPPRLNGRTIDYEEVELQPGDEHPEPFSFLTDEIRQPQLPCWVTYTTPAVHELIRANLHRAPMYTGQIQSAGPRYCPSIETKVVRFADRPRHQLFIEPEGRHTHEVYLNGLSTSLPRDVQEAMVRRIPGLAHVEILRWGYAIEYDYVPPDQLQPSLETRSVAGLFLAGQVNGTTGYEEAAGQGLLAGVNAALGLQGKEPLVLRRDEAYLGVMIDDLVSRSVDEPYRMFTSRAEYRLLLRGDNADRRLTPLGQRLGLISPHRWDRLQAKLAQIAEVTQLLDATRVEGLSLAQRLRRTEVAWEDVARHLPTPQHVSDEVARQITYDAKYSGYVARQQIQIERHRRLASRVVPADLDFGSIEHLRAEAREKFARNRPKDLYHASLISGITPADMVILLAHIDHPIRRGRKTVESNGLKGQDLY